MGPVPSHDDEGLFEHSPGASYLHLLRELFLTYRLFGRRLAAGMGVSTAQFELLRELALADGRSTASGLAGRLGVDKAAVTRLIADLETGGLVGREQDAADGRRRPVVLTPAGRRLMVDFHTRMHERESALLGVLEPSDIETAMRVLETIRDVMAAQAPRR